MTHADKSINCFSGIINYTKLFFQNGHAISINNGWFLMTLQLNLKIKGELKEKSNFQTVRHELPQGTNNIEPYYCFHGGKAEFDRTKILHSELSLQNFQWCAYYSPF